MNARSGRSRGLRCSECLFRKAAVILVYLPSPRDAETEPESLRHLTEVTQLLPGLNLRYLFGTLTGYRTLRTLKLIVYGNSGRATHTPLPGDAALALVNKGSQA